MDTAELRLNIVLIEDHDILRRLLHQALQEAGHQVVALSCAEELEDVAGGQPVDAFLIDLNLPGEDGLSLTKPLKVPELCAAVAALGVSASGWTA